jgi:hypothetical protein
MVEPSGKKMTRACYFRMRPDIDAVVQDSSVAFPFRKKRAAAGPMGVVSAAAIHVKGRFGSISSIPPALTTLESVKRAARDWEAKRRSSDWLSHSVGRLEDAERLRQREDLARFISPIEQAYLEACRMQDKRARRPRVALIVASVLLVGARPDANHQYLFPRSQIAGHRDNGEDH